MGHSAGGHLAAIVATSPTLLDGAGSGRDAVSCAVLLDAAAFEITPDQAARNDLYREAFGTDPDVLASASPIVQAGQHPDGVPDFLVVTRGAPIRVAEAERFVAVVAATGAVGDVVLAEGYTHEEVNTMLGEPGEQLVTPPVEKFLATCLA